jgi:hypothetical protein
VLRIPIEQNLRSKTKTQEENFLGGADKVFSLLEIGLTATGIQAGRVLEDP